MGEKNPLHTALAEEAKSRSYKRCGSAWVKDYGDLVAHIQIHKRQKLKRRYTCWISLFIKLKDVPEEYINLVEDDEMKMSPGSIHIYIPPNRSPDKSSHLLKIVNQPEIGPRFTSDEEDEKKIRREIRDAFTLESIPKHDDVQLSRARDLIVEWGFERLSLCKSKGELTERFRQDSPPFGIFLNYAGKYLT